MKSELCYTHCIHLLSANIGISYYRHQYLVLCCHFHSSHSSPYLFFFTGTQKTQFCGLGLNEFTLEILYYGSYSLYGESVPGLNRCHFIDMTKNSKGKKKKCRKKKKRKTLKKINKYLQNLVPSFQGCFSCTGALVGAKPALW